MSEVEKMYENAGVKKLLYCDICNAQEHALGLCAETKCEPFYPPFTPEKQLELVKWLSINYLIEFKKIDSTQEYYIGVVTDNNKREWWASVNFENALAAIINNLWQDLTAKGRTEIRSILNESN